MDSSLRGVENAEAIQKNQMDCHDLTSSSLAMTEKSVDCFGDEFSRNDENIAVSSLRGSLSDSENAEAIQKNKIDCHDSALPNFAMTENNESTKSHNDDIKSQKDKHAFFITHGFLNGKVITQIKGANGFGYDPIFVPNGFESTLAEMPSEAKNALSHRKIALDLMRLILCPLSAKNLS